LFGAKTELQTEREAWEGGVTLPLLGSDTLLKEEMFHLCVRGGVYVVNPGTGQHDYAHNKEGNQNVNIHY
jgi:hypothetical protein